MNDMIHKTKKIKVSVPGSVVCGVRGARGSRDGLVRGPWTRVVALLSPRASSLARRLCLSLHPHASPSGRLKYVFRSH